MRAEGALAEVVGDLHGCTARWLETVPIREEHGGTVVWEGAVEVFALDGHPEAERAYAWEHETDEGKPRVVAVLGKPPINSAADAVRAAIVQEYRELGEVAPGNTGADGA